MEGCTHRDRSERGATSEGRCDDMENSAAGCGVRFSLSVFRVLRCVAESCPARVLRRDGVWELLRVVEEQLGEAAAALSAAGIPSAAVCGVRVPAAAHASDCAVEKRPSNCSIPGVVDYGLAVAQSTDAGERGAESFLGDAVVQFDVWRADGMAARVKPAGCGECEYRVEAMGLPPRTMHWCGPRLYHSLCLPAGVPSDQFVTATKDT